MKLTEHHRTAEKDKVSVWQKLAYGSGASVSSILAVSPNQLAPIVLNIGLGVSPALVGLALTIPRIWDAFTDPLIGAVSDNSRLKMGRRRPFILLGALLSGILFMLMWRLPSGFSEVAYFWYFLLMLILFFTCSTVYAVPYSAMGYEMTHDYHEKTRVLAFASVFIAIGGFFVPWLFALTELPQFGDRVNGARHLAVYIGIFIIIVGSLPAFFCRERYAKKSQSQRKTPFIASLKAAFSNKPFLLLSITAFCMLVFVLMVNILGPYITIYYVYGGDTQKASILTGISGTAYYLSYMLSAPVITWVSVRIGKKRTIISIYVLMVVACVSKWFMYTPEHPYWQLVPNCLMAPGWCANGLLIQSMIADICDFDEWKTGVRREGVFSAVYSWITKTGWSSTTFISGLILVWTGFDVSLGGAQPPETLTAMRASYAFVSAGGMLIPLILICFYPLSEKKVYEIRKQLNERNAAEDSES